MSSEFLKKSRISCLAILLVGLSPSFAAQHCPKFFELIQEQREAVNPHAFVPEGVRNPKTGVVTFDLKKTRTALMPEFKKRGLAPDEVVVELDGAPVLKVSVDQDTITLPAGSPEAQRDCRLIFKQNNKEIHAAETRMFESIFSPVVDKSDYAGFPLPELKLPPALVNSGIDPSLVQLSSQLQREKINWALNKTANPKLKKAFERYGSDLKVSLTFGADKRTPIAVHVKNLKTGKDIPAKLEDFYITGGAAFNWNFFDWDSEFVKRYLRFYDPWLAENMRKFKIAVQAETKIGAQPRELRANLSSYHRAENLKFGEVTPNREYFNPPLAGWSERQVVRWDPSKASKILPEMIQSLQKQREWLLKNHAVYDDNQKLLGFRWSNLGSGRDNAARALDDGGIGVDAITYYKMMLDQEREFNLMLGNWAKADELQKAASKVADTINSRYWSDEFGLYVDLIPAGKSWKKDTNLAATGFWPAMAGVPDQAQMKRMLADNFHNPKRFGSDFFPPSTSKDSPHYDPSGDYWRGGGWPPDFVFFGDLLFENGLRKEASQLQQKLLRSFTTVSDAYRKGDSPQALINGKVSAAEKAEMKKRGTVFEFLGFKKDASGAEVPTFGRKIRGDGSMHETRKDFAGWGSAPPLESLRNLVGLDPVPAFAGSKEEQNRWIWALVTDRQFNYHQVRANPALKPIDEYLSAHPHASYEEFNRFVNNTNKSVREQLDQVSKGYLEISPSFDPEKQTEIKKIFYAGTEIDLKIERLDSQNHVRLTVKSKEKIRVQFNRNWEGNSALNQAGASSQIIEIGGDTPVKELQLSPFKKEASRKTQGRYSRVNVNPQLFQARLSRFDQ